MRNDRTFLMRKRKFANDESAKEMMNEYSISAQHGQYKIKKEHPNLLYGTIIFNY